MSRPRALVARLDNAGDVLLAGPAIRAVAAAADVTLLCGPAGRAAAELLPGVDEIVEFDAPWSGYAPSPVHTQEIRDLVETIAERGISQAAILTSWHQSPLPLALLLRLAGVERIAAVSEDYPGSLLDHRGTIRPELHEVEQMLDTVAMLGHVLPAGDDGALAVLPDPVPDAVAADLGDDAYVVVHPGASVPARAVPAGLAAQAVTALVAAGRRVVVTGAGTERTRCAELAAAAPGTLDLAGRLTFGELAGVVAGASAVVCGNTGPAHLAAATGTPVVSLFAPVVPWPRWRPWRVPVERLGLLDVACAGCRARACPLDEQHCIAGVTGADVAAAVDRLTTHYPVAAASTAGVAR